ncbi:MAG: Intermembrane phospholipid transport system binding protein MlaD [Legionellaceae bacterium]
MQQKTLELWVGIFIITGLAALFMLAFKVSGLSYKRYQNTYQVKATFDNIGSLKPRAPVTIAGVKIGQVTHIELNQTTFKATVTLEIDSSQNALPKDTSASILTEGLLGANYISLNPGYDDTFLKNGDSIQRTQPALVLENLIGQLIFKLSESKK